MNAYVRNPENWEDSRDAASAPASLGNRAVKTLRSDQTAQIVTGWLIKVVLVLTVLGLLGFEVVGVLIAKASSADVARLAAQESGFRYRDTQNVREAEKTARDYAAKEGAEFVSIGVDPRADTLSVTIRKKAKTLFIHNIGPLEKYTVATATETTPLP